MRSAPQLEFHLQGPLDGGANQHQRTVGGHFAVVARDHQARHQDACAGQCIEQATPNPANLSLASELKRAPGGDAQRQHPRGKRKIHHMPEDIVPIH